MQQQIKAEKQLSEQVKLAKSSKDALERILKNDREQEKEFVAKETLRQR